MNGFTKSHQVPYPRRGPDEAPARQLLMHTLACRVRGRQPRDKRAYPGSSPLLHKSPPVTAQVTGIYSGPGTTHPHTVPQTQALSLATLGLSPHSAGCHCHHQGSQEPHRQVGVHCHPSASDTSPSQDLHPRAPTAAASSQVSTQSRNVSCCHHSLPFNTCWCPLSHSGHTTQCSHRHLAHKLGLSSFSRPSLTSAGADT